MVKFKITKETTAGGLKKQFADEIGGTLRVYDGCTTLLLEKC